MWSISSLCHLNFLRSQFFRRKKCEKNASIPRLKGTDNDRNQEVDRKRGTVPIFRRQTFHSLCVPETRNELERGGFFFTSRRLKLMFPNL